MNSALLSETENETNESLPTAPQPLKTSRLLNRAIPAAERLVVKRDGTRVRFDQNKVARAIALAFFEERTGSTANPYRDDPLACYGLESAAFAEVTRIATAVTQMLELFYRDGRHPNIEQVEDEVEKEIAAAGHWEIARSYMLYRARRAERRLTHYADSGLSDYIAMAKYARYRPELGRREIFSEGVERVRDMHLEFFAGKLDRRLSDQLPAEIASLAGDCAALLREVWSGAALRRIITGAFAIVADMK